MSISPKDKHTLRRLAGEVPEIAALPVHKEKAVMWRSLNHLEPFRPLVWINEICREEMGDKAQPTVADPLLLEAGLFIHR